MKIGSALAWTFCCLALVSTGLGCGDEDAPRSRLLITRIAATDTELETYEYTFLSDVLNAGADDVYGTYDDSVFEDQIYITIENQPRSSSLTISPDGPYGAVVLTSYTVEYDVAGEYIKPLSGGMNLTVPSGSARIAFVTLVTAIAKTEPPLSSLAVMGGELMGPARVTFRGYEETSNQAVEVTGSIQVHFANWTDSN